MTGLQDKRRWVESRLKELDRNRSWLAKKAGISPAQLTMFLNDKRDIRLATWLKIENVLNQEK